MPVSVDQKRQQRRAGWQRLRKLRQGNLIPFQPFQRLVREVLDEAGYRGRLRPDTAVTMQKATEAFARCILEDGNKCALHARRTTLYTSDIHLAQGLTLHPDLIADAPAAAPEAS